MSYIDPKQLAALRQERERFSKRYILVGAAIGASVALSTLHRRPLLAPHPCSALPWRLARLAPEPRGPRPSPRPASPPGAFVLFILLQSGIQIFTVRCTDRLWAAGPFLILLAIGFAFFGLIRGCAHVP